MRYRDRRAGALGPGGPARRRGADGDVGAGAEVGVARGVLLRGGRRTSSVHGEHAFLRRD